MNSVWNIARTNISYPSLSGEREADTVIIGGGITGLHTAYKLLQAGQRVVVLEAFRIGDGSTGRSTGNLYGTVSSGLRTLRKQYDADTVRSVVQRRMQAVDFIEETVKQHAIDCGFQRLPMYLCMRGAGQKSTQSLEDELRASEEAGLVCGKDSMLPFPVHRAIRLENQAQFNPLSYVQGLAQVIADKGGQVFEQSRVTRIDATKKTVFTSFGQVQARDIVYATHTPKGINLLQAEMQPYQEYGVAVRLAQPDFADGLYWVLDDRKSIRGYRHGDRQYLLVIGGKHKTGHGEHDYYQMLKEYARAHFGVAEVDYQWSAQQYVPADQLPYIGHSAHRHLHVGTGFAADGLVWGTVAADVTSRQILHESKGDRIFSPWRFTPLKSGKNWLQENKTVATHWLKGRFASKQKTRFEQIAPGEGKVFDFNGDKVAAYRSMSGDLTVLSALCPHMKCPVHWNSADKTWDCPCHGSRFATDGKLLEGPAYDGLKPRQMDTREVESSGT